jgi:nickel-dependent lactate racemase
VNVTIRFDGADRTLGLPDRNVVEARASGAALGPGTVAPLDLGPVETALAASQRLLVLVNDGFRPTPTARMLEAVAGALRAAGTCRILMATGMHPAPPREDWSARIGSLAEEFPCDVHDACEPGEVLPALSDGSPLELNPLLGWADRVLLVGSVEPHFFAGFTGGAKQLLPGVATKRTIEANHRHAVDLNCRPCRIEGNPVAMPIREAGAMFARKTTSYQAVAGPGGWEYFAGDEAETFARATRRCVETSRLDFPVPLDLLIAVVQEPLDRNLYQLQKGFENHQWAVRDGGAVLLLSACREGVGNDFFGTLAGRYPDWRDLPAWEEQSYSLGLHKLYRTARTRRRIDLYLYSTLPAEESRRFYFEPVDDLDGWLDLHIQPTSRVGVALDAAATVSGIREN